MEETNTPVEETPTTETPSETPSEASAEATSAE